MARIIKSLAAGVGDACSMVEVQGIGWFELIYNNGSEHEPMIVISDYSANDVCEEIMREVEQEVES